MKNTVLLTFILLLFLFLTACSESDSTSPVEETGTPELASEPDFTFTIPNDFTVYDSVQVEYNGSTVYGYPLGQFIEFTKDYDERDSYMYQIVSGDDDPNGPYTPRTKGYSDLTFSQFDSGYLLKNNSRRTYFPDDSVESAFNVKYAYYFKAYYKVDIKKADNTMYHFEIGAFDLSEVNYYSTNGDTLSKEGFSLANLIPSFVTKNPQDFDYQFVADDGWVNSDSNNLFSWDAVQNGYMLPGYSHRAIFPNATTMTEDFKPVKGLIRIELVEKQR
ncbi:MAG: hypothetical protein PHR06_04785 [Candidatus Cloacimonetes bacterium]|nr:hypothetical protein [Candidatus Cloacimonadota bacterium]